jgi:2-polyprenyl-6-methoxyphenol hydroxylase-like FAD-dependent oxidoreductase
MATQTLTTSCCIAGGGPAGMMLGFLLARAGVDVMVLEKHTDFLRDFRGDTIHPSTLELMHELGLLEEFLKQPHQELQQLVGQIGEAISAGSRPNATSSPSCRNGISSIFSRPRVGATKASTCA